MFSIQTSPARLFVVVVKTIIIIKKKQSEGLELEMPGNTPPALLEQFTPREAHR